MRKYTFMEGFISGVIVAYIVYVEMGFGGVG